MIPTTARFSDTRGTARRTRYAPQSLIFLHRFGPQSFLYTFTSPGRFAVFVDPVLPVLTPEAMGEKWVVLCQDEVYVLDRVEPKDLTTVAVHRADADSVMAEFIADFRRLGIPLFDYGGDVLWEPVRSFDGSATQEQA